MMMNEERITSREAALLFMKWCEDRGGSVTLDADGAVQATVNWQHYPIGTMTPEKFRIAVDVLADDLRLLLACDPTVIH